MCAHLHLSTDATNPSNLTKTHRHETGSNRPRRENGEAKNHSHGSSTHHLAKLHRLKELYETHPVARAILDHAASRRRNQVATKVERMTTLLRDEGQEVIRDEIIDAFRRLEKLGAGQFVSGRGSRPSRFVWRTGMVILGRRAAGLPRGAETLCEERRRRSKDNARAHTFHLRADWPVTFHLPLDVDHNEIERLAAYLKTLPMASGEAKMELPHKSPDADQTNRVS